MAKLSAFAPESAVSASFPGTCSDKLQLLNGWLSLAGQRSRQAYRRPAGIYGVAATKREFR